MKIKIERLSFRRHEEDVVIEKIFEGENVNSRLEAIAQEIFVKERELGEGNFSTVFEDIKTGACCKKLKPSEKPLNNVHRELEFLGELRGLSEEVDVPMPLISMDAYTRGEGGKIQKCSVAIMETINGPSLDDVITGKRELPESFDLDKYFDAVRDFIINTMHRKGIYHRDIANRNLMIDQDTGKPFIIDFGDSVVYSYEGVSEGEDDPYGNKIVDLDNLPEDFDLKMLNNAKEEMRRHLTK